MARTLDNKTFGKSIMRVIDPLYDRWKYWGFAPDFIEDIKEIHETVYRLPENKLWLDGMKERAELYGGLAQRSTLVIPCRPADDSVIYCIALNAPWRFTMYEVPELWPAGGTSMELVNLYKRLGFFETSACQRLGAWAAKRYAAERLVAAYSASRHDLLANTTREEQVIALWPELFPYLERELRIKKEKRPRMRLQLKHVPLELLDRRFQDDMVRQARVLEPEQYAEWIKCFDPERHVHRNVRPSRLQKISSILTQAAIFYDTADITSPMYTLSQNVNVTVAPMV